MMRAVVQRVTGSRVTVGESVSGEIGKGLMVLLGIEDGDTDKDVIYMADKITELRIFEDGDGKMNLSMQEVGGEMLVVSQFTLLGDCRKGRRPSFIGAARPEKAESLYLDFVNACRSKGVHVEEGVFQAEMLVHITNDGPVTLIIDSRKKF
jgi:D-tyrosyl-tRNA(Tyr) deacylase